ncbi:MAG: cytochrome c3 family protein [Desulfuromonadaceae bacterium]|nr:cytochrome c3 family protein [Desulfuromonadaceae bacterium]
MKSIITPTYKSNILKNIIAVVSGACIFMSANPMVGNAYAGTDGTCLFSKQLQSSPMREQYVSLLVKEGSKQLAYNTTSDNNVQTDASDDITYPSIFFGTSSSSSNQNDNVDYLSKSCLGCHDGDISRDVIVNYRNSPGNKTSHYNVSKEHPIGMNYTAYSARDPLSYKPANPINSKMIFVNGRVGCLTCHDPLNPKKDHLVMSNFGSALCLNCHNK